MIEEVKCILAKTVSLALGQSNAVKPTDFTLPPKPDLADLSMSLFDLAKDFKTSPLELAKKLAENIKNNELIVKVEAVGPYLNFKLNYQILGAKVVAEILKLKDKYGQSKARLPDGQVSQPAKIMVEFAHPNTHKVFHIGHLRNIITGEAIARILAKSGAEVIRANYQGDIGSHIAKCLWGIKQLESEFNLVKDKTINDKVSFLSKAYVLGSKAYEEDTNSQTEIKQINQEIYKKTGSLIPTYKLTREWSLTYFDSIYQRLGTKFDRLYFESEVFETGKEIVLDNLKKGIFKPSQQAIIFPGEKYGLHSRVFITKEGTATYEAKDLALAQLQFKEYQPDKIIHVVAPEQADYFKVLFKALELVFKGRQDKEKHLQYGWVGLKKGKMSSRLGNVVQAEWLLSEIKKAMSGLVKNKTKLADDAVEKITQAAVKYAFLRTGLSTTINFDIKESISLSGDSGPYLLYTCTRIKSILRKSGKLSRQANLLASEAGGWSRLEDFEKQLILQLAFFPEICSQAAAKLEPSLIAKFLFNLTQKFSQYYHQTQILKSETEVRMVRLALIKVTLQVIENGLYLLGIKTVDKM